MASHTIDSYLSALLRNRLAVEPPLRSLELNSGKAVILLSDLEGFTRLVEAFSDGGQDRLETLTWILNHYISEVAAEIVRQGGDILSIAGDAFLCLWQVRDGMTLDEAVVRAAAAAKAIQQGLDPLSLGNGPMLRPRIGIGAGSFTHAFVGGHQGRWEVLLSGQALDDAITAEVNAVPGEVLLAPSAGALAGDRIQGPWLRNGRVVDSVTPPQPTGSAAITAPRESILPHLPGPVQVSLLLDDATWLAEARWLTVLFTSIPRLDDLPGRREQRLGKSHTIVAEFQAIVHGFEGESRLVCDDKGTLLLAIWGLPHQAHEDDALRALEAAWAFGEILDAKGLTRRGVGMATGKGICGAFGSDIRRDYLIHGNVINLAARLMELAQGDVLCDAATAMATRGRVVFTPPQALQVRGRSETIYVHSARQRRPPLIAARSSGAKVGRRKELSRLTKAWDRLKSTGCGQVFLVEGEAGLGKTSLALALMEHVRERGGRLLSGAADAIDRNTPYLAWRHCFASLMEHLADHTAMTPEALRACLPSHPLIERLFPLLASVLPITIEDTPITSEMIGDVRASNTRNLLTTILSLVAEQTPTLLLLEDAHWLDSASQALLLEIASETIPLLLVITARPTENGKSISNTWPPLEGLQRIGLGRFTDSEIDSLVCTRLGIAAPPSELMRYIRNKAAGHPFFCDELIQAMQTAGVITIRGDKCLCGELESLDIPPTIEGLILSNFDALKPAEQLCLKIAAVVGFSFDEQIVSKSHPMENEVSNVSRHLTRMVKNGIIVQEDSEADQDYSFRHVITRDVIYNLMPLSQRQPLHRRVAQLIEQSHPHDVGAAASILAYHWNHADNKEKALHYLGVAGEQALRDGVFTEAAKFFEEALLLTGEHEAPGDIQALTSWHRGLGLARYFLGDMEGSREALETAIDHLDRPVPKSDLGFGIGLASAVAQQAIHRMLPHRLLRGKGMQRSRLVETSDCYRILGQLYYRLGEPPLRLAYLTVRGVNIGELAGASPALARVVTNMSVLTSLIGLKKLSRWYSARAMALAEGLDQYSASSYVWHISAIRGATDGNFDSALTYNSRALALISDLGDYNLENEAQSVRSMLLSHRMELPGGPEAARRCLTIDDGLGGTILGRWALLNLADFALAQDDLDQAQAHLNLALRPRGTALSVESDLLVHRTRALVMARRGRWQEAVTAARAALAIRHWQPTNAYYHAEAYATAAEVLVRARLAPLRGAPSRQECQAAVRHVRRLAICFWNIRPRADLLLGLLDRSGGNVAGGRRGFSRAAEDAARRSMPYEQARALLERAAITSQPEAAEDRAHASRLLAALGITRPAHPVSPSL